MRRITAKIKKLPEEIKVKIAEQRLSNAQSSLNIILQKSKEFKEEISNLGLKKEEAKKELVEVLDEIIVTKEKLSSAESLFKEGKQSYNDEYKALQTRKSELEMTIASLGDGFIKAKEQFEAVKKLITSEEQNLSDIISEQEKHQQKFKKQKEDILNVIKDLSEQSQAISLGIDQLEELKNQSELAIEKLRSLQDNLLIEVEKSKNELSGLKVSVNSLKKEKSDLNIELSDIKKKIEDNKTEYAKQLRLADHNAIKGKELDRKLEIIKTRYGYLDFDRIDESK